MMLVDSDIIKAKASGFIDIKPWNESQLGSNSYDLTLGHTLLVYTDKILDAKKDNKHKYIEISDKGFTLLPSELYLGTTREYTSCNSNYIPCIEGTSSAGRLGIQVHMTAGFGDAGFRGHWTLEMTCVKPVIIYAGMPIAQIYWTMTLGKCTTPYSRKSSAHYHEQLDKPVPSAMWTKLKYSPAT